MKENEIHQAFIAWLNKAGVLFRHDRTDKRTTTKVGEPDFVLYAKEREPLFIEVKVLGGQLRPEQRKRIDALRAKGLTVEVCFSDAECVHAATLWLGSAYGRYVPFQGHPSKPLDCHGISGGGKGKADTR